MFKVVASLLLLTLFSVYPASAQVPDHFSVVQAVDRAHPELVQRNDAAAVATFMQLVVPALAAVDPRWGYLSKSPSENGLEVPGVGRVAVDAVAYRGVRTIVDILSSAGDGPGTGRIGWSPTDERRDSNLWIGVPNLPPPGPPAPAVELAAVLEAVRALSARLDAIALSSQNASNAADAVRTASEEMRDQLRVLTARPWPVYQGRFFGQLFTLTPR